MKVVGQPSGKLIADAVREWSSNLGRRRGSLGRQPGVPGGCVRTPAARQALQRGPVIDAFSDDDEALTNHYHHQLPVSRRKPRELRAVGLCPSCTFLATPEARAFAWPKRVLFFGHSIRGWIPCS